MVVLSHSQCNDMDIKFQTFAGIWCFIHISVLTWLLFHSWSLVLTISLNIGKCQKACKDGSPRSCKKKRNEIFRSSENWQESPTPFSWWYNCHCFILKPWLNIQRHSGRTSSLNKKCCWPLILFWNQTCLHHPRFWSMLQRSYRTRKEFLVCMAKRGALTNHPDPAIMLEWRGLKVLNVRRLL